MQIATDARTIEVRKRGVAGQRVRPRTRHGTAYRRASGRSREVQADVEPYRGPLWVRLSVEGHLAAIVRRTRVKRVLCGAGWRRTSAHFKIPAAAPGMPWLSRRKTGVAAGASDGRHATAAGSPASAATSMISSTLSPGHVGGAKPVRAGTFALHTMAKNSHGREEKS